MTNIEKYLNSTTSTSNGIVYKNDNAFQSKIGICYIGEYDLQDLQEALDNGIDYTDDELIENSIADTYGTIMKAIDKEWEYIDDDICCDKNELAEYIYANAEWASISTYVDELTY